MIANIIILTIGLIGTLYIFLYLNRLWSERKALRFQQIVSEDTVITPQERIKRRSKGIKWKVLILVYLAVLIGMLTTAIYRDLKGLGTLNFGKFRVDFLLATIVSPLVLQGVLATYPDINKIRWHILLLNGYQNGFFWQTIFGELAGKL
jgi:formate hydrogenlyase subunit 3/multisubunit Na+/H+ antiporter MnhD subunit